MQPGRQRAGLLRDRNHHAIDQNLLPIAADFIALHAGNSLDQRGFGRQISALFNKVADPLRYPNEDKIAAFDWPIVEP